MSYLEIYAFIEQESLSLSELYLLAKGLLGQPWFNVSTG